MKRRLGIITVVLLVLAALAYGLRPRPIPVQTGQVERGPLRVTVEEEGETRIDDLYTIAAPVAAHLRRIKLKPGDLVERGQVVAQLEAPRPVLLDARTKSELSAREEAAKALVDLAETAAAYAVGERDRVRLLYDSGAVVSIQARDQADAEAEQALAARRAAVGELDAVRAMLREEVDREKEQRVVDVLRAPVSGRVLAVHHKNAGPVAAGIPLMEIGDLDHLDVVIDVLSRDAVQIRPGMRVLLDQWGREDLLEAEVTRIAPAGYTSVSALGVEEQRVPVEARITSPRLTWESLGAGYRVLARFIVWEENDVLQAPAAALFRSEDGWAAFVVRNDQAELTPVRVGRQAALRVQIVSGLSEGDTVIVHPSKDITHGIRVKPRRE